VVNEKLRHDVINMVFWEGRTMSRPSPPKHRRELWFALSNVPFTTPRGDFRHDASRRTEKGLELAIRSLIST
jgi:hypothetical protein